MRLHSGQECSRVIKMRRLSLRPLIKKRGIDDDLAIGSEFELGSIHGSRGGPFEVDPFAVIAAAVAWTFEFVFGGLPVRSAAQMCAASVDHKQTVRCAINPNAIFLLKFGVDPKRKL